MIGELLDQAESLLDELRAGEGMGVVCDSFAECLENVRRAAVAVEEWGPGEGRQADLESQVRNVLQLWANLKPVVEELHGDGV